MTTQQKNKNAELAKSLETIIEVCAKRTITNDEIVEMFDKKLNAFYEDMNFGNFVWIQTQIAAIAMAYHNSNPDDFEGSEAQKELYSSIERDNELIKNLGFNKNQASQYEKFMEYLMNEKLELIDSYKFFKITK